MSPTIVLKDGKPVMTVGAAGGPKIITQVLLAIVRLVDGQQSLSNCVTQPRIHHQWRPNRLFVESTVDASLLQGLKQRGHDVELLSSGGVCQAISQTANGTFVGIADPRVPGKAAGF